MAEGEHSKRFISDSDIPLKFRRMVEEQEKEIYSDLYEEYKSYMQDGNLEKAIEVFTEITRNANDADKRQELRELYAKLYNGDIEISYQKVIEANINSAKSDYAEYLISDDRVDEAVYWFVEDEKHQEAAVTFNYIDIFNLSYLQGISAKFSNKHNKFTQAIDFAVKNFTSIKNIPGCVPPPKYISLKYILLTYAYSVYRIYKTGGIGALIGAVIIISAAFFIGGGQIGGIALALIGLILMPCYDFYLYNNWVNALSCYEKMPMILKYHKDIDEVSDKFKDSEAPSKIPAAFPWVILILIIGFFAVAFDSKSDKSSSSDNKAIVSETASVEQDKLPSEEKSNKEDKPLSTQKTELSLGGIDIGISKKEVNDILGAEKSSETKGTSQFLKYDAVDVEIRDGIVYSLISNNANALTKRSIHQESELQDVLNTYGQNYSKFDYDNLTMYEYIFYSMANQEGILRFAINKASDKVDYISVRIADTASKPQKTSMSNDGVDSIAVNNEETAKEIFLKYHRAISSKSLKDAYVLLSPNQKNVMGDFETFSKGYKTTDSSTITDISLASSSSDSATFNYSLTAVDKIGTYQKKHQTFEGTVTMVKQNGNWFIDTVQSKKTGEWKD